MFLGDAHRDGGGDDDLLVERRGARVRDGRGGEGVGPERRVGAVLLFGAADRENRQVGVDRRGVGPRGLREVHDGEIVVRVYKGIGPSDALGAF